MYGNRTTVFAVLALLVSTAVAHGVVTARWKGGSNSAAVDPEILAKMVPAKMGAWVGSEDNTDIDDPGLKNLTRRYTHVRIGRSFLVSLTKGHPGLTAVHTPEYCYRGSGYDQIGPVEKRTAVVKDGAPATFFTTQFGKKTAAGPEQLRIFWAWSAGQGWAAPDWPRVHYLGQRSLFKLYVVGPGQPDCSPGKDPALDDFLSTLLGTLDRSLFSPPAPATP
jgi:hypothetical protein